MPLRSLSLDELTIDDEASFRHVALYASLKQVLRQSAYRFRAPARGDTLSWDRALFLNLSFWSDEEQGDVLVTNRIAADVVMHVAWHHLVRNALGPAASSADGLLLGESIASAFDLYLVGRLLGHAPESSFLESQVPAMADVASANGLDEAGFEALLEAVVEAPERAFEDLRALLFTASTELVRAKSMGDAEARIEGFEKHRFGALLHHYELSNWVLSARAQPLDPVPEARAIDSALRSAVDPVAWLSEHILRNC